MAGRRWLGRVLGVAVAVSVITLPGALAQSAGASTAGTAGAARGGSTAPVPAPPQPGSPAGAPTTLRSPTPAMAARAAAIPSSGAPLSTWQAWASIEVSAVESVPWAQAVAAAGCTLEGVSYTPVPADMGLPQAPAGVDTVAAVVTERCPPAQPGAATAAAAATSSSAGGRHRAGGGGDPCTTIGGPGNDCVGVANVNGTPNFVYGVYAYWGSYTTGHVELSSDGGSSSCQPGSLLVNGNTRVFYWSTEQAVYWGPTGAADYYASTFWHSRSGGYTDYGTECGYLVP